MSTAEKVAEKLIQYEQEAYEGAYGDDWLEQVGEGFRFYAEYCAAHKLRLTMAGWLKYIDGLHAGVVNAGNIPDGFLESKQ